MQKSVDSINSMQKIVFTEEFISKFRESLCEVYSYEKYMDFVVVTSIFGKKILCDLPIINYTDRSSEDIEDLLELSKESEYQIRVLNFNYIDFKEHDTVTMRIDIQNYSSDEVFMHRVKKKCRTKVRKSLKNGFSFSYGNSQKYIEDFYKIYSSAMYMHGTPALGVDFFKSLVKYLGDDALFYNSYDGDRVISSYCVLLDREIAWAGWGGVDMDYRNRLAGYFSQWQTIKSICDEKKDIKIFDFGRSPYDGGTYEYKSQFGAIPVKIDILTSHTSDIYAKYSLASNIWKKLPKSVVGFLGPKLCKYLVDL